MQILVMHPFIRAGQIHQDHHKKFMSQIKKNKNRKKFVLFSFVNVRNAHSRLIWLFSLPSYLGLQPHLYNSCTILDTLSNQSSATLSNTAHHVWDFHFKCLVLFFPKTIYWGSSWECVLYPFKSRLVVLLTNVLPLSSGLEGMENQLALCLTITCCCLIAKKNIKRKKVWIWIQVCARFELQPLNWLQRGILRNMFNGTRLSLGELAWQTLKILLEVMGMMNVVINCLC